MAILRCMTPKGIREFENYLGRAKDDADATPPVEILEDPKCSTEFPLGNVTVDIRSFANRREFAEYINARFEDAGIRVDVDVDGMWEWLSLFYLDVTCPVQADGSRKIGEPHRHLVQPSENRNPRRHLLRGAYMLHRRYGISAPGAIAMLMGYPIDTYPLVWTHLNERPSVMESLGVLSAAGELFYDSATGHPKPGLGRDSTGIRRFGKCIVNLPTEFDLATLSPTTILALLPMEFDDWIVDPTRRAEVQETRELLAVGGFHDRATGAPASTDQMLAMNDALDSLSVRKRPVVKIARKVRSDMFRIALLNVYDSTCSVSGLGLVHAPAAGNERFEVEAAHIIPVAKGGEDSVTNGLALNRTIHWAFDNGMIWIDSDYRVNLMPIAAANERNRWLNQYVGKRLSVSKVDKLRPNVEHLRWHAERVAETEFH